jgi:hypothetical protein
MHLTVCQVYNCPSLDVGYAAHRISQDQRRLSKRAARPFRSANSGAALAIVVLLEQHRADRPNNRGFFGKDADDIAAAFDFFVEPLARRQRCQAGAESSPDCRFEPS